MRGDKKTQSDDEFWIGKAVKTTIQKPYDKGFFDNYNNTDEVIKDYLLIEYNERSRPDLVELDEDIVIQGFYSYIQFEK